MGRPMTPDVAGVADSPHDVEDVPSERLALTLERSRRYGILLLLACLFIILSVASDAFLTKANLLNILDQNAAVGIVACTLTLVIIAGHLDFSAASVFGLASVAAAGLIGDLGLGLAILAGFGVGVLVGLANGYLVALLRIDSFICTLATGIIVAGLTLAITRGDVVSTANTAFSNLGNGTFADVSYPSWVFIVVVALLSYALARTVLGKQIYAIGDNYEAARLSGLRVQRLLVGCFVVAGFGAALAGVLASARTSAGQPQASLDLVVTAIAAIVIGGTSVRGGSGAVWRTVAGVFFLALIGNGLSLLNIDPVYQQVVQGGIILFAVALDRLSVQT